MMYLSLNWPQNTPRGPGFWKSKNTLLEDQDYIGKNRDNYPQIRENYKHVHDKRIFWELLKMGIRSITIAFTKKKAKILNKREFEVKQQLDTLDVRICASSDLQNIDQELKMYDDLKKELQKLYERKGKAAMFRAKCRWLENWERPNNYFFNLEKQNYNKKIISELEKQILSAIESYYNKLYTSKCSATQNEFHQFTHNLEIPKLSNAERDKLEVVLTYDECKETLQSFNDRRSPGEDDFTVEFFRTFFDIIGRDLVEYLNAAHDKGQLPISQRRGVITLIPKDEDSLLSLKNWRPITLLIT